MGSLCSANYLKMFIYSKRKLLIKITMVVVPSLSFSVNICVLLGFAASTCSSTEEDIVTCINVIVSNEGYVNPMSFTVLIAGHVQIVRKEYRKHDNTRTIYT